MPRNMTNMTVLKSLE